MPALSLRDVHRRVGDRKLLDGVSFSVEAGERVGLLGVNGSGKSTLLRMAAGVEQPDRGERTVARDARLLYLEQEPVLPDGSVADAIRDGLPGRAESLERLHAVQAELSAGQADARRQAALLAESARLEDELASQGGYDVEHRVDELIDGLQLRDRDALCPTLSGGERRRVALARALIGEPDLLLLDEPTNHLDAGTVAWLEDRLVESQAALLLVTHDRYLLDRVCERILELDRGRLHSSDGGYVEYLHARAEREVSELHRESKRQTLLRREGAWMRRGAPARTTKARARIQRYEKLVSGEQQARPDELVFSIPPGPRLGTRVFTLSGVRCTLGGRTLLDGLDLEIQPRDRLGVLGPNGAGKSTLLALLAGKRAPDAGSVARGETVRCAFVDQERSELDPTLSVLHAVAGEGTGVKLGELRLRAESFLEQFMFPGALKYALVGTLSGGERNRVQLAQMLLQGGNVLLLDEPTNDLDLASLAALEEALVAFAGAVVVVSHDRAFLDRVCTRTLHLDGHGGARIDVGGASNMLAGLARERAEAAPIRTAVVSAARVPTSAPPTPALRGKRLSNWEHDELLALPAKLEAAEARLTACNARLADPALYAGKAELRRAAEADHAHAQAEIDTLFTRWEQLEQRRVAAG